MVTAAATLPVEPHEVAVASPIALACMCRLPDAPGGPAPWDPWEHQKEVWRALLTHRKVIVLKARQLGMSRALALYALWYVMSHAGAKVLVVSIGEREASAFKQHLSDLFHSLPDAVKSKWIVVRDNDTILELAHENGLRSKVTSLPSSATAGRGETSHLLILDEGAHYERANERMGALMPTAGDVGQVVLSSTAKGLGNLFEQTWNGSPLNGWHPIFVPPDARPDRSEAKIEALRAEAGDLGPQEYPRTPTEAFLASGRCAFHVPSLQVYLENRCTDGQGVFHIKRDASGVYAEDDPKEGMWRVWRFREPGRDYVITGDPCGGRGGEDFAAMAVYDRVSSDQVAAFHGKVEPDEFAKIMVRAGWLWSGHTGRPALLVPESNNHGHAVIALLREWRYPALWTYERIDQRRDAKTVEYGWPTTSSTRHIMLASLKEAIREGTMGIRDRAAIGEMMTFVVKVTGAGNEREEAETGMHDDRVIAHAIASVILQRPAAGVFDVERYRDDELDPSPAYRPRTSSLTGY